MLYHSGRCSVSKKLRCVLVALFTLSSVWLLVCYSMIFNLNELEDRSSGAMCSSNLSEHDYIELVSEHAEYHKFEELVLPHIKELELVREKALEQRFSGIRSIQDITDTARATSKDYFQTLSKYPEVTTLFLHEAFSSVKRTVRSNYYQYGASDCDLVESTAIYGGKYGPSVFNKTCQPCLETLLKPEPLQFSPFKSGLPEGFKYTMDNVTLTYLSVFSNAVIQPNGDVRYKSLHVIPQRCNKDILHETGGEFYDEVFTIAQSWGEGFYHSMIEDIPRIAPYLEFLKKYPSIFIHITAPGSHIESFMALLGISAKRLVSGIIRAGVLYLPAGSPCGRGALFNTQMLSAYSRTALRYSADIPRKNSPRKMVEPDRETPLALSNISHITKRWNNTVILQRRSTKRWFKNHNAIAHAIKQETEARGLEMVIFSDTDLPSFTDTVSLFDSAVLVVAPHGAGESNMLFARPGTPLVEGLCKKANLCYRNLLQNLGHRYYGVLRRDGDCFTIQPHHLLPAVTFFLDNIRG